MSEQAKEKWEIAKYLIDAKKAVDTLWYISKNVAELKNINLHKKTGEKKREFYLNCRIAIEKAFSQLEKQALKASDSTIKEILTQADQNYAHKDPHYKSKPMTAWKEILEELKGQLSHLRQVCAKALPDEVTLNFVPHDKELFRQVHKIGPKEEEEIRKARHPGYGKPDPDPDNNPYLVLRALYDIEQLKEEGAIQDPSKYGVVLESGINPHEELQNRQGWCIKVNFLHGQKMWCSIKPIKWDRNAACHCYSGKKYKCCCADVD